MMFRWLLPSPSESARRRCPRRDDTSHAEARFEHVRREGEATIARADAATREACENALSWERLFRAHKGER